MLTIAYETKNARHVFAVPSQVRSLRLNLLERQQQLFLAYVAAKIHTMRPAINLPWHALLESNGLVAWRLALHQTNVKKGQNRHSASHPKGNVVQKNA